MDSKKSFSSWKMKGVLWAVLFLGVGVFFLGLSSVQPFEKVSEQDLWQVPESDKWGIFIKYHNQIYAQVPGDGSHLIPEADAASFQLLSDKAFAHKHIGIDKYHVYCANQMIPQLNPANVRPIADSNYYTDGIHTVYCHPSSSADPNLSMGREVWQRILYALGSGTKPQSYIYAMKRLPSGKTYQVVGERWQVPIVSDGEVVYYQGEPMEQANGARIHPLSFQNHPDKVSRDYFSDGERVYYHRHLIPVKDDGHWVELLIEDFNSEMPSCLYNVKTGMLYVEQKSADQTGAPYQLLTPYGSHENHVLFTGAKGIYFCQQEPHKFPEFERAGDNPFLTGTFKRLSPHVFCDGTRTLYLQADEKWGKSRKDKSLHARSTLILELADGQGGDWERLSTEQNSRWGSVWRNGQTLYYFDNLGDGQLIRESIYRIEDEATGELLLQGDVQPQIIWNLYKENKLRSVSSRELLRVTTRYKQSWLQEILGIFS